MPEAKTITFEQFRMLSTGMSEAEILATAGQPFDRNSQGGWIYFRDDGYVVTLTFVSGKVFRIDDTKIFNV
jgi:hypothetical protein